MKNARGELTFKLFYTDKCGYRQTNRIQIDYKNYSCFYQVGE